MAEQRELDLEGGRWVTAPCPHNCGGKCLLRLYIKDGKILRQGTDISGPDDTVNRQQRACPRGWAQSAQMLSPDRLRYPLKRKHWSPEAPNGHLRGQDEWERISWDEAAQYIADEISRINAAYGDNAILCADGGEALFEKLNINYLSAWTTSSWGGWYASAVLGWEDGCGFSACNNDRLDMLNCEYVVAFGYNPAWGAMGNALNYARAWKDAGTKFILFDPIYTDTAAALDTRWVAIRPGTDMAAMLAMAYVMLEEDAQRGLIDWDFLDRCCVGFDGDHMPGDARDDQHFFGYLRGEYDGVAKTPQWAEAITGVPADTLREVARVLGRKNRVALFSSWASARNYNTEQLPQLTIALGAMGGHIGKSGHTVGPTGWNHTNNFGPRLIRPGSPGETGAVPGKGKVTYVSQTEQWDAVLGKPFNPTSIWRAIHQAGPAGWKQAVSGYNLKKGPPRIRADVRMILNGAASRLTCAEGAKQGIKAHRAVEFVVGMGQFMTATNRYSDIVLPISTAWERDADGYSGAGRCNRDILCVSDRVLEPYYESVSDEEAYIRIGEKLGLDRAKWGTVPARQRLFNAVAGTSVLAEDGKTWENLCTITPEDVAAWGVTGAPQQGRIPLETYMREGIYRVKRHIGDKYGFIHMRDFYEDPCNHPIDTMSGKIEFYCQTYADIINGHGFADRGYHGLPKYQPIVQGYESTFLQGVSGAKTAYPLQCINPHYPGSAHSIFANIPPLREAFASPVYLAQADADARGICDGDAVSIESPYGQTLRRASVSPLIMPGVVGLPHGRWTRVDEKTGVDHGGCENYITGQISTGMGISGYNALCVQVSKWAGEIKA